MDKYSPKQIFAIRKAIERGRQAMSADGIDPLVFASAYLEAGGVQIPGQELDEPMRRRIDAHILESLGSTPTFLQEKHWIIDVVSREIERIHSEVKLAEQRQQEQVRGFRFRFSSNSRNKDFCARLAEADLYGLGPGVFPRDEVVVLPPSCDQCWWEPVLQY
ncbi:MAG TPA: hypothetical protein VNN09_10985 [Candidatus Competibacteraceae bacterium]|nr:hypothetical protein [Candidatus Competibacteraceae bacterium]